jgi:hypothetical protein
MKCKNCDKELSGQKKFCSNCGQKNIDKLNIKYLLGTFIDDFFNVDSKLFQTLKYLILKPGFLSKEYIEGKRAKYLPPIRLYIVLSVLFFFLISINFSNTKVKDSKVNKDEIAITSDMVEVSIPMKELQKMDYEGTLDHYLDSITTDASVIEGYIVRKSFKSKLEGEGFNDIVLNQISLFLLLFMPFLALLYASCFSRNKKGFVGHLIFNFHLNSFIILFLIITLFISWLNLNEVLSYAWSFIAILYIQVYLVRAIILFYNRKWWVALYKYILLIFGYSLLAVGFMVFVILSSMLMV